MQEKMNIIVERGYYNIKKCEDNPQNLYVFGENVQQKGTKFRGHGQAEIRPCKNTFGFRTKKSIREFWSDENYNENIQYIEEDIKSLLNLSKDYTLVFPINGLGTGLSALPSLAPKTFLYMSRRLLDVFGFNNIANLKSD